MPPDLVTLSESDLAEIASFVASQSGKDARGMDAHLRWFLLKNPARRPEDPLGFGLRSADRLVGCILLSPQLFRFEASKILFMGSSSFYVDEKYRGQGGRIFLQYCRLGKREPLFGTSANAEAAALWKAAGASPIPFSDGELFGVLRWPPVAEEFAHRRYSNKLLARFAGSSVSNLAGLIHPLKIEIGEARDTLRPLTSAEEVDDFLGNDSLIHTPSKKLTALRDLPYIRWRYFSGHDSTTAAFAFRTRRPDREILVTVNQRQRGYRGQIKVLNVLDVYPEVSIVVWFGLVGALIARFKTSVDAVVLRGLDEDQRKAFLEKGFQLRLFDAPNGWFLDKKNLLPKGGWYSVPADGDGLI